MTDQPRPDYWCILTMSPGRTIPVARALAEAGYAAWTPIEVRARLAGRTRKMIEQACAITPSFVFAGFDQRHELAALCRAPSMSYRVWDAAARRFVEHGVPYFTMFRHRGDYPRVTDASLAPLRAIEARLQALSQKRRERARRKGLPPQFFAGDVVRVTEGAFGGMDLIVVVQHGKMVDVTYPGWTRPVAISAWTLSEVRDMHDASAQAA